MKKEFVTVAVIGAGDRGQQCYARYLLEHPELGVVVAVAEPNESRRLQMATDHQIERSHQYEDYNAFFEADKMCDAVFICTNDEMHFEPARLALEKGYHVLLEKPMSNTVDEIRQFEELASHYSDRIFTICHVLRYTPFFTKIKDIIESGAIGDVVTVQHNENVGYFHIAHSYVRGNWRDGTSTSPIILAKSCHDLDILRYLVGSGVKRVSSFGGLRHFKQSEAPQGATTHCMDCMHQTECAYSAPKIYRKSLGGWPTAVFYEGKSNEELLEVLKTSPYGRCVYYCDNNVCDHQSTLLEFENGVTATFNLSGFTHDISRTLKIMGTKGEIRGHMEKNSVEVYTFNSSEVNVYHTADYEMGRYGHGGGDAKIIEKFMQAVLGACQGEVKTMTSSVEASIESHLVAFAIEEARLTGSVVTLADYRRNK